MFSCTAVLTTKSFSSFIQTEIEQTQRDLIKSVKLDSHFEHTVLTVEMSMYKKKKISQILFSKFETII